MTDTKSFFGQMPGVPLSGAVRAGDFIFVSGQVPFDKHGKLVKGDIKTQTLIVMERIQGLLDEAGCHMDDIVKCNCWLEDEADFEGFNDVYKSFFSRNPPARATVKAQLMVDAKVEVDATAWKPLHN
ncbi:MAG: hypothetical protein CMM30_06825 [Rhodospirillaceae bacterium]|nr:hypothetical protein [Rhodospirillaceae bacterium]|tara:strand:- start:2815 stop:3195 length:381 start_codon:yes stop_codon:yes gene_type:complete